jgi:hypothetical protein
MDVEAKRRRSHDEAVAPVLSGRAWLSAYQTGCDLGDLREWVRRSLLFAIESPAGLPYPAYAFDRSHQPLAGIGPVLAALDAKEA